MKPIKIDENKMIDLYVNQKLTAKACAIKMGVSQSTLVRRLKKNSITVRPPTRGMIEDISNDTIIDLYRNQHLSIEQTAQFIGRSTGFVRGRLKKAGVSSRSLSESTKIRKGTSHITNEQLIYLHDVRDWTCAKISRHFGKSEDFVRQRFLVMGKNRRQNVGKYNGSYIDGRTPLRTRIRDCAKSLAWKQICMERDNYTCQSNGQHGGKLEVHHFKSFSQIFEEFLSLNSDLDPENDCDKLFEVAQYYDPFWDISNGTTLSEKAHHTLHTS